MKIKTAIVDDHHLFRKGLIRVLEDYKQFELWGEFKSGDDLIKKLSSDSFNIPDVLIVDYQMPGMTGIDVCKWLKENMPEVKPIIISQYDEEFIIQKAVKNGAMGYLLKTSTVADMVQAVESAFRCKYFFNDVVSVETLISLVQQRDIFPEFNPNPELTEREKDIIKLICKELTYKQIAEKLSISQRTVEAHKENILTKIGANKVTGIVLFAAKSNIV